jgi:hypothetical protein
LSRRDVKDWDSASTLWDLSTTRRGRHAILISDSPAKLPSDFQTVSHLAEFQKEPFHMPVTIATEPAVPMARPRRTANIHLGIGILNLLLAAWAIIVLMIASYAVFGELPPFPGAFDVSIAPF